MALRRRSRSLKLFLKHPFCANRMMFSEPDADGRLGGGYLQRQKKRKLLEAKEIKQSAVAEYLVSTPPTWIFRASLFFIQPWK